MKYLNIYSGQYLSQASSITCNAYHLLQYIIPSLKIFQIKCEISQCLFSPCGQYLAGCTIAGQIAVWEVQTGLCLDIIDHPTSHRVSAMMWNPKGIKILYVKSFNKNKFKKKQRHFQ